MRKFWKRRSNSLTVSIWSISNSLKSRIRRSMRKLKSAMRNYPNLPGKLESQSLSCRTRARSCSTCASRTLSASSRSTTWINSLIRSRSSWPNCVPIEMKPWTDLTESTKWSKKPLCCQTLRWVPISRNAWSKSNNSRRRCFSSRPNTSSSPALSRRLMLIVLWTDKN